MSRHVKDIISRLRKEYPGAKMALRSSNPLETLVATILSAQCTDERVNIVTKDLFKKYRTAGDYAKANQSRLEKDIRSTGFFRNKAKNIIKSAQMIVKDFSGKVPDTMEEILTLPGVARKTANIVLGNSYGVVEGIAVDTHVRRLSALLGLTKNDNPEKIEQDLMKIVEKKDWFNFPYLLQAHGRKVCIARRPKCMECVLKGICPSANIH